MAFVLSYHGRLTRYTYLLYDTMCFNMVGGQGVEPRIPKSLIYSQVQSPVLLTTHVLHQIVNERYNRSSIQQ